mmetsp:Transcript_11138/g.68590  ORF Transcript_11138/g.68590 Transcript_11138/m.68590 type:complete len:297 (-) Transcript_11138:4294-5184(-)
MDGMTRVVAITILHFFSMPSLVRMLESGKGSSSNPASYLRLWRLPTELVVSTVFHSKDDPQRRKPSCRVCEDYFAPWLRSLRRLNISTLIIHDGLPQSVLEANKDPLVSFVKVGLGRGSVNDERFRLYYALLTDQPLDLYPTLKIFQRHVQVFYPGAAKIFFTDAADVQFLRNPFPLVDLNREHIFIGSENRKWIKWMKRKVRDCGLQRLQFQRRQMYNAGILGGRINVLSQFLHDFLQIQEGLSPEAYKRNCNMPVFNAVARNWIKMERVQTGFPLHSSFLAFECNQSGAFICHK